MQNELKPISFYEDLPEHNEYYPYYGVQEFLDAIFVPYTEGSLQGSCSLCCLNKKKNVRATMLYAHQTIAMMG